MPGSGVLNAWAAAAQAAAAAAAPKAGGPEPAYRNHPRTEVFTCKACQVQERATLPNYYTAYACWYCGDQEATLPRPTPRPGPDVCE